MLEIANTRHLPQDLPAAPTELGRPGRVDTIERKVGLSVVSCRAVFHVGNGLGSNRMAVCVCVCVCGAFQVATRFSPASPLTEMCSLCVYSVDDVVGVDLVSFGFCVCRRPTPADTTRRLLLARDVSIHSKPLRLNPRVWVFVKGTASMPVGSSRCSASFRCVQPVTARVEGGRSWATEYSPPAALADSRDAEVCSYTFIMSLLGRCSAQESILIGIFTGLATTDAHHPFLHPVPKTACSASAKGLTAERRREDVVWSEALFSFCLRKEDYKRLGSRVVAASNRYFVEKTKFSSSRLPISLSAHLVAEVKAFCDPLNSLSASGYATSRLEPRHWSPGVYENCGTYIYRWELE
ncbi:unnamed protein product [Protopolystoma xenopodis]|uniref:Uncharacterized protein n=1 Tax=Protopolystoma xenopodis TaxID=117903 RepID=A0A448XIV1_9PLAT|nr:unnamed protein product [Protopolystoma xenopodis]